MVKVYGYSDDNVEIEGSSYSMDEIGCYDSAVRITFNDGTVIRIWYGKGELGIWCIVVEHSGKANWYFTECEDEEAEIHSDIFEIDAEVVSHEVLDLD